MAITLLCVGKIKEPWIKQGIYEYEKRLRRYTVKEIKDSTLEKESVLFLKEMDKMRNTFFVCLDEHGEHFTSVQFAEFVKKKNDYENICFLIGSADGLHSSILSKVQKKIALSRMTFTHEMARLFFTEQLYRAFSINEGKTYHRV